MIPEQGWNSGGLLDSVTHVKVINVTTDLLSRISITMSEAYGTLAQKALAARELFSYKFPAQGLKGKDISVPDHNEVVECCTLIAELVQLMSECVETEFAPEAQPNGDFGEYPLRRLFEYKGRYGEVNDDDDYDRLGYMLRRVGAPVSIVSTSTEGLVEDFFHSWDFGDEEDTDSYRPDEWQLIFPFP